MTDLKRVSYPSPPTGIASLKIFKFPFFSISLLLHNGYSQIWASSSAGTSPKGERAHGGWQRLDPPPFTAFPPHLYLPSPCPVSPFPHSHHYLTFPSGCCRVWRWTESSVPPLAAALSKWLLPNRALCMLLVVILQLWDSVPTAQSGICLGH